MKAKTLKIYIKNNPIEYTIYEVWRWRTGWRLKWHRSKQNFTKKKDALAWAEKLAKNCSTVTKVIEVNL